MPTTPEALTQPRGRFDVKRALEENKDYQISFPRKSLAEVRTNLGGIHYLTRYFRSLYPERDLNYNQFRELGETLFALPAYLSLRSENPLNVNQIPRIAILTAQAVESPLIIARDMVAAGEMSNQKVNPFEMYAFSKGQNPKGKNYFSTNESENPNIHLPIDIMIRDLIRSLSEKPHDRKVGFAKDQWRNYLHHTELGKVREFANIYSHLIDLHQQLFDQTLTGAERNSLSLAFSKRFDQIQEALGFKKTEDKS